MQAPTFLMMPVCLSAKQAADAHTGADERLRLIVALLIRCACRRVNSNYQRCSVHLFLSGVSVP